MRAFLIGAILMIAAVFGTVQVASADGSCPGGAQSQTELSIFLADSAVDHVSLTGDTFDKFAASIEEQTGIAAPDGLEGIVGPLVGEADGTFLIYDAAGCPFGGGMATFSPEVYIKALTAAGFGPEA